MDGGLEGTVTSYTLTVQASDGTNTETVTVEITVTPPIIVPAVEILAQTSSMEAGQSASLKVRAFDLDAAESYSIDVTTDGANLGFAAGCTDQEETASVTAEATTHEVSLTLHGCAVAGGTVTATLLEGTETVGKANLDVTVETASTGPSIQVWGRTPVLVQGQSDQLTATAFNLAPLTSYFVTAGTDNPNLGFSARCLIRGQEDVVSSGDASHTMTSTLHGCAVPGGTVTVELIKGSSTVVDSAAWDVQVVDSPTDAPPGPTGVEASLDGGVFTIGWDAVTGATNYLVEHRTGGDQGTWSSVATGANTSMDYTPDDGATCGATYDFRVRAYGDGAFYVVDWGIPSEAASVTTEDCNLVPEFDPATYTFTVSEDAVVDDPVGTVTATVTVNVTDVAEDPPQAPSGLTVTLTDRTFTISWTALDGAAEYEVQHKTDAEDSEWTALPEGTAITQTYTPEGGEDCETTYKFRVRAYRDGETYTEMWGPESAEASVTTESCNVAPVFDPTTYAFSVTEDAEVGDDVGTVTATDADDTLTYSITAGNDDGKFNIDGSTGEITVAGTLDRETKDEYTLTVLASNSNGETATATVTITVVDAACSGGVAGPDPDDNPGLVGDCQVLMGAMDTLIGTGTTTLNWDFGVAMTTWDGVTVGGTPSRVTGLNLRAKGLAGSIPTTLGSLSALQNLNLSSNQLTGAIPTQLGNLSDLTALWLYNNQLSGGIPSELGSLSDLVWLILSGNQLTGAIPSQIGDLSDLSHLWLQDNQLSGEIPQQLGGLSSMQILRMHNNELTGPIPWQLGNLTGLSIIHVSGNELEGCVPPALENVANNDFPTLGLSFCTESGSVSTPTDLTVTLSGETFTISWTAVTEADKYGVEYRIEDSGDEWTRLPTTEEVSIDHSPEGGPVCESTYEFRVRAYGDGETYSSSPGEASDEEEVTTGPCTNPPVFDQDSYTFSVAENVVVSTSVGSVSATDPDADDTLTYSHHPGER